MRLSLLLFSFYNFQRTWVRKIKAVTIYDKNLNQIWSLEFQSLSALANCMVNTSSLVYQLYKMRLKPNVCLYCRKSNITLYLLSNIN